MKIGLVRASLVVLTLATPWIGQEAQAQANCVSPPVARLAGRRAVATPLRLTWTITAASPGGRVQTTGPNPTLVQALPPLALPATETIVLPTSTVQQLLQTGTRRLLVVREFVAGPGGFVGGNLAPRGSCVASVEFTSALGGPLAINRMQLRFEDSAPLRIVEQRQELNAWADLEYTGGGEIVGVWEIAEPTTSAGTPVFRPLGRVRRQIEGGGRVSIRSPELPTDRSGMVLLRLQVLSPDPPFTEPVLRYYVSPEGEGSIDPVGIMIREPPHLAVLGDDTVFRWRPVRGAMAYSLELHPADQVAPDDHLRFDPEHPTFADLAAPGGKTSTYEARGPREPTAIELKRHDRKPIAGAMVDGRTYEARLSAWARTRLEPGGTYVWVVRAQAAAGIPIGMSPPRLIRVPE